MEKMKGMGGFFTAALTPMDAEGRVSPETLLRLMDRNLNEGAAGFLIGGSSAEAPLLSHEEKECLLRAAAAHPRRKEMKLIGSNNYDRAELEEAAKLITEEGMDLSWIISSVLAPEQAAEGFERLAGTVKRDMKILFKF